MGSLGTRGIGIVEVRPSRFGNLIEERVQFAQCPESAAVRADESQLGTFSGADLRKSYAGFRNSKHRSFRWRGDQLQCRRPIVYLYPGELPRFATDGEKSLATVRFVGLKRKGISQRVESLIELRKQARGWRRCIQTPCPPV